MGKAENKGGRPTVMTEEVLQKLLEARADGATDVQACLLAEIGVSTYYKYVAENPEFVEKMDRAKDILSVLAGRRLRKALDELDVKEAMELAWQIIKHNDSKTQRSNEPPKLPPTLGGSGNINVHQTVIRADDLTDDELLAISAKEKTLEEVLAGRRVATKPKE
jgi:hypothetical protein